MNDIPDSADLLVIGGGIHGAGIARDAAGRGLRAVLCERGDFAGATSSASSKLIHGGLRYLEQHAFRLVREALGEREILLRTAPHLTHPLLFVVPLSHSPRPAWLIRIGLFLYDHLGTRRTLAASRMVKPGEFSVSRALRDPAARAFVYADCQTDDARLTVLTLRDAADRGATVLPRVELVGARVETGRWRVRLADLSDGREYELSTRTLINAAGPWIHDVLARTGLAPRVALRLVKGSHIVVPRTLPGDDALLLQNRDGRVVFVIPWEEKFTLIGTTDEPVDAMPDRPEPSSHEIDYLIDTYNDWFAEPIERRSIVHRFAGVRALQAEDGRAAAATSRDFHLDRQTRDGAAVVTIYGGKLTTYRRLAEHVIDRMADDLPVHGPGWTATAPLPGGDIDCDFADYSRALAAAYSGLPAELTDALARRHGRRCEWILRNVRTTADLGRNFGGGLYEREVEYLRREEWAMKPEDVIWRRTRAGLHMSAEQRDEFTRWWRAHG